MIILTTIISILVLLVTPLIWWYITISKYKCLEKIPGPPRIPIIGNNVLGTTITSLLESFFDLTKKYGGIVKIWLGPRLHLLITKPETVEYFLTSNTHLSKSDGYELFKPWLGDGLIVSTGSKWRMRRKLITPTFHFKILEKFLDTFNYQLNILVKNLESAIAKNPESIEITYWINFCSLDVICETAFGVALNSQSQSNREYVEAVSGWLEIFTLRFFSGWKRNPILFRLSKDYKNYHKYLNTLHSFARKIISKRKEEYKFEKQRQQVDDLGRKRKAALLDMLLEVSDDGKTLSDEDIREEAETFMFAGHDTTTTAISFTLYALAQNPEIQEKVYEEMVSVLGLNYMEDVTYSQIQELSYLDIVIKEAIRIYPPVPLIERGLEEDCIIDEITIPKGTNISIFLYGMNHSSDVFPEPEKFNVDRFLPENQAARHNFAYVPFAAGPRNCIGQRFAMLELKTALAKLIRCFKFDVDPNKPPHIGMCSVLKSKTGIHLKITKR